MKKTETNDTTPLHICAAEGDVVALRSLLEDGADIDIRDELGKTALHLAAGNGHPEVIRALVELGTLIDVEDFEACRPLHDAAQNGETESARVLLELGAELSAQNRDSNSPIHLAAKYGRKETVYLLIHLGEDPNLNGFGRYKPLHFATRGEHHETMDVLTQHGADASLKNDWGETPAKYAVQSGRYEKMKGLINNYGYDDTPLQSAVKRGYQEKVQELIAAGADIQQRDSCGNTALHMAAAESRPGIIHALLKAGADVNTRNEKGRTPLHSNADEANTEGWVGAVEELIRMGADPNALDERGNTPLHLAAKRLWTLEIAAALVRLGANIEIENHEGKTPLYVAAQNEISKMVDLLIKLGADETRLIANENKALKMKDTLEQLVLPLAFITKIKLGKYSKWAASINANELAALIWAVGIFSHVTAIAHTSGKFLPDSGHENLYPGLVRKLGALETLAQIPLPTGPSGVYGWLERYSTDTPVFIDPFRKFLLIDQHLVWAQSLDEKDLALLLWMVGEYAIRGGWGNGNGPAEEGFPAPVGAALAIITRIYYGEPIGMQEAQLIMREATEMSQTLDPCPADKT